MNRFFDFVRVLLVTGLFAASAAQGQEDLLPPWGPLGVGMGGGGGSGGGAVTGSGATNQVTLWSSSTTVTGSANFVYTEGVGNLRDELDVYENAGAGFGGWVIFTGGLDGAAEIRNYGNGGACNWNLTAPTGATFRVGTCTNPLIDVSSNGLNPVWPIVGTQTLGTGTTPWGRLFLQSVPADNTLIEWRDSSTSVVKSFTGLSAAANNIINNSAAGDFVSRTNGTAQLFSTDSGTSPSLTLSSAAGPVIINNKSTATTDFVVVGDTNANLVFGDVSADAVGFGTASPTASTVTYQINTNYNDSGGTLRGGTRAGSTGTPGMIWGSTTGAGSRPVIRTVETDNTPLRMGTNTNTSATGVVATISDVLSETSAGTTLASWFGSGMYAIGQRQAVTCAAGVLALDPTSSVVYLDANGAACVVTLGEGNAQLGADVTIVITGTPGAGLVTFPDVANVHDGPTLCTTTGIGLNSTYTIHYADETNDLYVGKACTSNT